MVRGVRLCGVALSAAAAFAVVPSIAATEKRAPKVRTLLEVRGSIEGFAQDGNHIAWANAAEGCRRLVQLRNLSTGKTVPLLARNGPTCSRSVELGGFQHRMALAGTRALWAYVSVTNTSFGFTVLSAAPGDRSERVLGHARISGGLEDPDGFGPLPLAGDAGTLVYADISNWGYSEPLGVYRVTRRAALIDDTRNTVAVAASGGRVALARGVEAGCACSYAPQWSPDGEWIVFESARAEFARREIYLMRADGTDARRLTAGTSRGWSPDGTSILYEDRFRIFTVTRDGRTRRLADGSNAAWAPDGRSIAYARSTRTSRLEIAVSAVEGGAARSLGLGEQPSWSPDGSTIAFVGDTLSSRAGLYVRALAGGQPRRVRTGKVQEPTWSPDGSRIAFWLESETASEDSLRVVRRDGSGEVQLAVRPGEGDYVSPELAWSPDSSAIAFSGKRGEAGQPVPWVTLIPASGGEPRFVAPGSEPHWSTDGRNLAYAAHGPLASSGWVDTPREIARVAIDGSGSRIVTRTTAAPARNAVEVRRTTSGAVVAAFDVRVLPRAVALAGSHVALLVRNGRRRAIELRTLRGALSRTFAVPKPTGDEIFMSAHWIVFRTGNTIRAVDARDGRRLVLARAKPTIVGLSVDGRRVAWAEQGRTRSRIRALVLPRS